MSPDILARYNFTVSPDVFQEGAAMVYLGPGGSRIVMIARLSTDSRVAVRKSWDNATDLLEAIGYRVTTDYERNEQLEQMGPPEVCVEALRSEGTEETYLLPFGATMCAADPNLVAIVAVSGQVLNASGIKAPDAVVGLLLQVDGSAANSNSATAQLRAMGAFCALHHRLHRRGPRRWGRGQERRTLSRGVAGPARGRGDR